jgi:hypothetical protein
MYIGKAAGIVLTLVFTTTLRAGSVTLVDENFNSLSLAPSAQLPAGWTVDTRSVGGALPGPYGTTTGTNKMAGPNLTSSNAGIYNFGPGSLDTDRAVGFISEAGSFQAADLFFKCADVGPDDLLSLAISYDVEKYRNCSSNDFFFRLFYSTDGSNWTYAGDTFKTAFAKDANNNGFANAPGDTKSIVDQQLILDAPIAAHSNLYFAWNYGSSITVNHSAQALAIDNVHITGNTADAVLDIPVNPVPLPAAAWAGTGMLGLMSVARCRRFWRK